MSLIQKPFDDSGVEFVDDISRLGLAIVRQLEHLRARNELPDTGNSASIDLLLGLALCDSLRAVVSAANVEHYLEGCAQAAQTLYFELDGAAAFGGPSPLPAESEIRACYGVIETLLANPAVIPNDESIPTQTVLMALVWAAVIFTAAARPLTEARRVVQQRIMAQGQPESQAYH